MHLKKEPHLLVFTDWHHTGENFTRHPCWRFLKLFKPFMGITKMYVSGFVSVIFLFERLLVSFPEAYNLLLALVSVHGSEGSLMLQGTSELTFVLCNPQVSRIRQLHQHSESGETETSSPGSLMKSWTVGHTTQSSLALLRQKPHTGLFPLVPLIFAGFCLKWLEILWCCNKPVNPLVLICPYSSKVYWYPVSVLSQVRQKPVPNAAP